MSTETRATKGPTIQEQAGFGFVKNQTATAAALQREFLSACEEANRQWTSRLQSEAALWSELMAKLTAARSAPEFFEAYSKGMSQRLQMTMEDSRQMVEDYQKTAQKLLNAMANGSGSWHV